MTSSTPTPARLGETAEIRAPELEAYLTRNRIEEVEREGPIAPGQEDLLAEFLQEQGLMGEKPAPLEDEEGVPEKFKGKSAAEIAKAYADLEKLASSKGIEAPTTEAPAPAADSIPDPAAYTPERGQAEYGEQLAAAFTAAEVNPYQLWQDAAAGKDVSPQAKAIAEKLGVAESVVTSYIANNVKPAATAPATITATAELTEADGKELRALVGGDAEFEQLATWVKANATDDLPAYQQAVESGNKPAVAAWLKAFQVRREAGMSVEPQLEGGGNSPGMDRFNSQSEVFEAMRKTDSRGRRLYDVDDNYQREFQRKLARSPDFK